MPSPYTGPVPDHDDPMELVRIRIRGLGDKRGMVEVTKFADGCAMFCGMNVVQLDPGEVKILARWLAEHFPDQEDS